MAFQYLKAKLSILPRVFQPGCDAVFSTLPFWQRWRLVLLQPINVLVALVTCPTWLFNNRYSVIYVPIRSGKRRCLVWQPSNPKETEQGLRPLHIDLHGGGFIGGLIEQDARWCQHMAEETGTVVVSCEYRIAPRHTFPAAHDDIDDIVSWILENAEAKFNADVNLLTIGGGSAGGNLALSAAMGLHRRHEANGSGPVAKALIGFCPLMDLRIKPEEKPKPPNFPTKDPLFWMLPMYDIYPGPTRAQDITNPRLNPIVAAKETLPEHILFIVAGIDILLHEQLTFIERVRAELEREGNTERRVEVKLYEKGFHGWLELPKSILEEERIQAFSASISFIKDVHREHGFYFDRQT